MIDRKSGVFQSAVSIIGNFMATGISAVSLILITRLLGPEKFGIFSVGFSLVLILIKLNEMGLHIGVVKFASATEDNQKRNVIFSLTTKYKLVLSAVIAALGVIGANLIASLLNFSYPSIILASFTIGLSTVYYEQLLSMLQSLHRFSESVVINAIQAVVKLVGAGAFLLLGVDQVLPIFSVYILAPLVPLLFYKQLLPHWVQIQLKARDSSISRSLFNLTKHASVALISAGIIENIDVLFLQRYLSTYEAGLYGGVSRIAMMFALVAYSLGNVLNARVAKYKDRSHLDVYLRKALLVVIGALVGFSAFIPFAQAFIWLTIGPDYLSGTGVLLILTAASFLAIAAMPFIAFFYTFEADWYFSVSGICQLAIVLIGNYIFVPLYGLEAAAWTRLLTRLFLFIFTAGASLYLYRKHYVTKTPTPAG